MAEQAKDIHTEQRIKDTAKDIFFSKGNLHATTQEVADAAGVNRALIHYYFRNREQLFQVVLQEALKEIIDRHRELVASTLSFREKLEQFLDTFIQKAIQYPYLENFVITEFNRNPCKNNLFPSDLKECIVEKFLEEVEIEIQKGNINPIDPKHFIINIMSLCGYPLIAKPIVQTMFAMSDEDYKQFLVERRNMIMTMIFKK